MPAKAQIQQAHITYHKRAKDAGPEQLRAVLGSIVLKGPRPAIDYFDDGPVDREDQRAGD